MRERADAIGELMTGLQIAFTKALAALAKARAREGSLCSGKASTASRKHRSIARLVGMGSGRLTRGGIGRG